jgi:hypothetical protein
VSTQINGQDATPSTRCGKNPIDISLIALIASPQQFDKCFVRVMGVINVGFEGDAIFLHEEDYKYGLMKNSLRLHLSDVQIEKFKKYSGSHVILEGVFYGIGPDSRESTSGAIANITRLDSWGNH